MGAVPSAAGVVVGREDLGSPTRAGVLEVRLEVDRLGRRHELQLRYERLRLRVLDLEPHHELLQESEQVDHLELCAVAGRELRGGLGLG